MNITIFGLSISSSWGNGHATIWRGLVRSLIEKKHKVTFFEKNVPYYEQNRDFWGIDGLNLIIYNSWPQIEMTAASILNKADISIITSYCPDAILASDLVLCREVPLSIFYDLDAAVTIDGIENGERPFYIGKRLLKDYDIVLSYTGGVTIEKMQKLLAAKEVFPLYGCVDPLAHRPVMPSKNYKSDLSYLGTFAADRQEKLNTFFINPAKRIPNQRFLLGGSQYPEGIQWNDNISFISHVPPSEHSSFYCSSKFTLNITRHAMANMGFSPSGRIFEASACGVPVISDEWMGIERFFTPKEEIIIVRDTQDVIETLHMPESERLAIAGKAYLRVIREHTAANRIEQFEKIVNQF
jgi:spore maturation protein CgeB